jgi:hypothetical protein
MNHITIWDALCEQLCPGDISLRIDVQLSISNPQGYLEKFDEALSNRGIEESSQVQPLLALVDGLISRGFLSELDWKFDAGELAYQLEQLKPCKALNVQLLLTRSSNETGDTLLTLAATELEQYSLVLLFLDIDGDCYPLLTLPLNSLSETLRLSQLLKLSATFYGK